MKYLEKNLPTVVFDDNCGLCGSLVKFLRKIDKKNKLHFISNGSLQFERIVTQNNSIDFSPNSVLFLNGNEVFNKSIAVLEILNYMPYPWKLLNLINLLPNVILNKMYDFVAENRYLLFGRNKCKIEFDDKADHER